MAIFQALYLQIYLYKTELQPIKFWTFIYTRINLTKKNITKKCLICYCSNVFKRFKMNCNLSGLTQKKIWHQKKNRHQNSYIKWHLCFVWHYIKLTISLNRSAFIVCEWKKRLFGADKFLFFAERKNRFIEEKRKKNSILMLKWIK